MGMFDSLYDANGGEWQTKALGRGLSRLEIGDRIPILLETCQIEVLGELRNRDFVYSFATIRDGVLVEVPAERDPSLPRVDYVGRRVREDDDVD